MSIFFTSDLHFDHTNIIKHSYRPFFSIGAMNDHIIQEWNKIVTSVDTVYILGDFTLVNKKERFLELVNSLRGIKFFIPGNHDKKVLGKLEDKLKVLPQLTSIHTHNRDIVLCHFPLESWDKSRHGAIHLHGHAHGMGRQAPGRLDVGPDNLKNYNKNDLNNWFKLWKLEDVLALPHMDTQNVKPVTN